MTEYRACGTAEFFKCPRPFTRLGAKIRLKYGDRSIIPVFRRCRLAPPAAERRVQRVAGEAGEEPGHGGGDRDDEGRDPEGRARRVEQ